MATMIHEVYDAFRDAQGVSDEKARKAAEAVAAFENRFATIDVKIEELDGQVQLLQWMVGFAVALNVAILLKLFTT